MSKHTPGPWLLENRGYKFIVSKPGDGYITRDVCRMDGSTMAAFEQEANAQLIAAAPDLLEALKTVTSHLVAAHSLLERGGKKAAASDRMFAQMMKDYEKAFEAGRAAIAKAGG